jgi:hypothetical protein
LRCGGRKHAKRRQQRCGGQGAEHDCVPLSHENSVAADPAAFQFYSSGLF